MTLRLSSLRAVFLHGGARRIAAATAAVFAMAGAGHALAALGDAASAPAASASEALAAGAQYTIRPGQSLNDVAIAVTQSHDRATLARASRALFDANPNAFMGHDPSRMRLGAVLTIPALDASGAGTVAASGAAGAAAPASNAVAAGGAAASAAGVATASAAAQVNAAAASAANAASAAAHAVAPAAPAVTAPAQASAGTANTVPSASVSSGASNAVSSTAPPVAGSQANAQSDMASAAPASGAHEWSGSIQSAASGAVVSASAPVEAPTTSSAAPAAAQPASQARPQVSSLQQLLALKNRVLMELQKHGIGGTAQPSAASGASAPGAQAPAGASAASAHSGTVAQPALGNADLSQTNLSIAAAIGAALVVLLSALGFRRRRRAASAPLADMASGDAANPVAPQDVVAPREPIPVATIDDGTAQRAVALAAADARARDDALAREKDAAREAAEREAAARDAAERAAAEHEAEVRATAAREAEAREAEERAAAEREALARETAAQEAAARETAEREAAASASAAQEPSTYQSDPTHVAQQAETPPEHPASPASFELDYATSHETFGSATTAASLAAAAELGAEALPLTPLEPVSERFSQDAPVEPSVQHAGAYAPTSFPRDAVDAFSSLDMPLPPRTESNAPLVMPPASLTTQPVVSPETTAQQAIPAHDPDHDAPHVADEIGAGTAGPAAVAGLGAAGFGGAGFGALNLDFDLELPPSAAQPLPAFTPADLARIARNKLELAGEYIELGDLAGARALINEVIEANDPATRSEARTLLSTLAPLS